MDAKELTIGEKIRTFRLRAEISQTVLAEAIGVHLSTLSRWERDEGSEAITVSSIRALGAALNVPPETFISSSEEISPKDQIVQTENDSATKNPEGM